MPVLNGKSISKIALMQRIGDVSQIAGVRYSRLKDGKADGMPVADFKTGTGFHFSVLPGRALDICWAEYKGIALGFVSKTGVAGGCFYEHDYDGFHRNFFAGLLTTCGLRNIGGACDDCEPLGLHGRISNTPAENISIENRWHEDEFLMGISGDVRESKLYCENLLLRREITTKMGEKGFVLTDTIENCGFRTEPLTLLYHFNFGYPLLDETAYAVIPYKESLPRDETARKAFERHDRFETPQDDFPETVFFYKPKLDEEGNTYAALFNPQLTENGLGISIVFNGIDLPCLTEWKNMGKGDYVVALEPGNCYPMGRKRIRERGELAVLEPGEVKKYTIEFSVLDGLDELKKLGQKFRF